MPAPSTVAVLGAGHAGPVIARLAIAAGYQVDIATSGDPEDIALVTELVIPGARPRWAADAIADSDIVVLAIPLPRFLDLEPMLLNGRLVIDAMNYWPATDGVLGPFEGVGSSEVVAGLVDRIGYDPVRLESLRAGRVLQPGGPVFGVVLPAGEFCLAVHEDARSLR